MKIIVLLIGLSLILALTFLFAFYKALKNDQFEDLESPAMRILDNHKSKKQKPK